MQDLSDHPFSPENIAYESGEFHDKSDRAWRIWCAEAERLLGHDLDGNDPDAFDPNETGGDGYSLDEAYIFFEKGRTPHGYVGLVGSRDRYHARKVAK